MDGTPGNPPPSEEGDRRKAVVEGAPPRLSPELMRNHTAGALRSARKLRASMSLPEVLLWRVLKQQPLGLKFRRQHPIERFVADFYCDSARTVIEIDGIAHDMGDRPERDVARDAWLKASGLNVVRVPAVDILRDVHGIAQAIAASCSGPPPSALRAATSPGGGGSVRSF